MFRKLSLLVFAVLAAMALSASAASAGPVHVENSGDIEVEGETTIAIGAHTPIGFVAGLECDNLWSGTVSEEGHVDLSDVEILPHPNQIGNCAEANDCNDAGWEGQGHEREGANPPSEFGIDFHFCLSGQGGGLDGLPVEVECSLYDEEAHCDDPLFIEGTGIPITQSGFPVEVLGEVTFHQHLGLMHG